ncbi:DUF5658 family protein [Paenibacillus koleovorans]|uniref:DUF5658 family protein n=1 Tax=Paenibacillus koleovorans TaxID=121608 RepID=UPI000FDA5193|nr:DUF5658 family protein [Paenibacillus koleovorans]
MNRLLIAFVCVASCLDALLTDLGLRMGLIGEANPIMRFLYENSYYSFYALKIALPLSLFILAARVGQRLLIHRLFRFSAFVYAAILLLHTFWLTASINPTI